MQSTVPEDYGAEIIDLEKVAFTSDLLRHVPAALAHKHQALPLRFFPGPPRPCLRIVLASPINLDVLGDLHHQLGYEIETCVADANQLRILLVTLYPPV